MNKEELIAYYKSPNGLKEFKKIINNDRQDESMCPMREHCGIHSAKKDSISLLSFFVIPCWRIGLNCICPIKEKIRCEECMRFKYNKSLC